MTIEIRTLEFERRNELRLGTAYAFGWDEAQIEGDPDPDFDALHEVDRARAALDGNQVVGTLTVYSLEMTVPGGTLPTAGTTGVTVHPTHRRRGILRQLMAAHFEDVLDRREPLAALWASESVIYPRFGYGVGAEISSESIDRTHTAFREPVSSARACRMVSADEARALLPGVYDEVRRERPGMMARNEDWWRHRTLLDAPYDREGASPYRRVVYEQDGRARGYLLYRMRGTDKGHHVVVRELMATDPDAAAALYSVACSVDLVEKVWLPTQPVESPLSLLLADPRRLRRQVRDALWVRIMDTPSALAARAYSTEGTLTLSVRDDFRPDNQGTVVLEASGGRAKCQRVSATDADVELDISDLGSVYTGAFRFRNLARAGRARGTNEALARADALFAWDPPPFNGELF